MASRIFPDVVSPATSTAQGVVYGKTTNDVAEVQYTSLGNYASANHEGVAVGIGVNSGTQSVVVGHDASSVYSSNVLVGFNTHAGDNSIAIGYGASTDDYNETVNGLVGAESIAIGSNSYAYANNSVVVGALARTSGLDGVAIGHNADVKGYGVAVGSSALATLNSTSVGYLANFHSGVHTGGTAIGYRSHSGDNSVSIGYNASTYDHNSDVNGSQGVGSVAIGQSAYAYSNESVAIGNNANTASNKTVVIGSGSGVGGAEATLVGADSYAGVHGIAMGKSASAYNYSINIGHGSDSTISNATESISIGYDAQADYPKQLKFGAQQGNAIGEITRLTIPGMSIDWTQNPQTLTNNTKTSAYTLAATDNGAMINTTAGVTISTETAMTVGQNAVIFNNSGSSITITQASVTMRLGGTATTGNRTLAGYGLATIVCVASNTYVISGAGLT